MLRTKGEAGTGNVVEAVRHARRVLGEIRRLQSMSEDELFVYAKEVRAPPRDTRVRDGNITHGRHLLPAACCLSAHRMARPWTWCNASRGRVGCPW